jgi:hypothetical protein
MANLSQLLQGVYQQRHEKLYPTRPGMLTFAGSSDRPVQFNRELGLFLMSQMHQDGVV